jgi:hypothetical protein
MRGQFHKFDGKAGSCCRPRQVKLAMPETAALPPGRDPPLPAIHARLKMRH